MSETINNTGAEQQADSSANLPSRSELLASFSDKKATAEQALSEVRGRSGVTMNANEIMAKRREEKRLADELRQLEDSWNELGGADIDAARARVDSLNFKSDATDHVRAKKGLQDAEDAFYQNFVSEHQPQSEQVEEAPFNLAEAANDPNIDEGTRKVLRDINDLLTAKPQKAIEGVGGSAVEQEAQRLIADVENLEAQGKMTPEQRALVQSAVDGIIAEIDSPLDLEPNPMAASRIEPIPAEILGVDPTERENYPALESDQAVREGESMEEYEARMGGTVSGDGESTESSDDTEFVRIDPIDLGDEEDPEGEAGSERMNGIRKGWTEYMLREHADIMEERQVARDEFLKIIAKSEKGHLRRIKPDGWVAKGLRSWFGKLGGNKLADSLTKPTAAEKAAGDKYAEALAKVDAARHNFMGHEYDNGNISLEELKAERTLFMTAEHAMNTQKIADLQKESGGKPMNKWWRRAGYVGAGVTGGLLALTPLGWVGGVVAAGVGAGALRVGANKKNANLKGENVLGGGNLVVDGIAQSYHRKFVADMQSKERASDGAEISADDIVGAHYDEASNEIGKNRNRLIVPTMGAAALALMTNIGINQLLSEQQGTLDPSDGVPDPQEPVGPTEPVEPVEPTEPVEPVEPEPEIQGTEFTVERGNGYTHELQDFAEVNGEELSGDEAWRLHNEIMDTFGPDYMDINGPGGDIYREAGDVRLMEPGAAQWKEGVPEFIMKWMANR